MFDAIYSPIQQINFGLANQLFIKRDDLIDPYISGNKWRKLKYILANAEQENKNHLVTFGGAYSNHLVATAAATARLGLKATAFVRGEKVENEMLLLCKLYGMHLIFVDRTSYKNKQQLFDLNFANDNKAYFIDEGGACTEAIQGCAEIIDELKDKYDYIFVAAGTGTTAAGLLKGIWHHQLNTQLHVIPVLKDGDFIKDEIGKYVSDLSLLTIHTNYHFGGYAKTTPMLLQFIQQFSTQTGLLLDPIYTGKMMFAINDLVNKGIIKKDAKILAIHTGGLLGILGKQAAFNKIFT